MKKTKSVMLTVGFLVAAFSLIVAANAGYVTPPVKTEIHKGLSDPYYATITYHVYEGDGCECVPMINVPIVAQSRDSDHNDSNVTDEEGMCTLHLNYNQVYRVSITSDGFESVLYDFLVIDNQPFVFNLKKSKVDSEMTGFHLLELFLQRFSHLKHYE